MKIILASKSPRRRKMFEELGIQHTLWDGEVDETLEKDYPPCEQVKIIATKKATACFNETADNDALIISADTIVALEKDVLGKPKNDDHAREMLRAMSGTFHYVYSGICAVYKGKTVSEFEKTEIKFRDVTDREIERYIKSGEHRDKAGSYGIQEKGGYFVESINGDLNNVVGLPVLKLRNMILNAFDVDIFDLD